MTARVTRMITSWIDTMSALTSKSQFAFELPNLTYVDASLEEAQRFLSAMNGEREISQTETDVYRQTEIQAPGWKVFRLTTLLPKTGFDLHVAKMTTGENDQPIGVMRRPRHNPVTLVR